MANLPGRCINEMFCPIGASGRVVHVPQDTAFVCPVCGKGLIGPTARRSDPLRSAAVFVLGVEIAVFAAFGCGALLAVVLSWPNPPRLDVIGLRRLATPVAHQHTPQLGDPPPLTIRAPAWTRGARHSTYGSGTHEP